MTTSEEARSFWETFFRVPTIQVNGVELPLRDVLNFITDAAELPEDDAVNERTNIPITGDIVPGGDPGNMQWYRLDGLAKSLAGTDRIKVIGATIGGELQHGGKPIHNETWVDFRSGSATDGPRSQWSRATTTNTTSTPIGVVSVPAATFGDCGISVHAETSYVFNASGTKFGKFIKLATFQRSSGTLTRIGIADLTPSGLSVGTIPGGHDVAVADNDTIDVNAIGIASTNIVWTTSYHIHIVVRP